MVDLNDVFDDIVLAENNSFHRGFQEGVEKSRAQGFADGFGLGLGKGLQVGTSIGYYRQFAELALRSLELSRKETQAGDTFNSQQIQEISSFPIARKEKLEQSLKSLLQLISEFGLHDCEDEAIFTLLEKIESKYKQTKALLNLKLAKSVKPPSKDLTF